MWWPGKRRRRKPQVTRREGDPIPDGDTILFPGQRYRVGELVTRQYPVLRAGTDNANLVRPYVNEDHIGRHPQR